MPSCQRIHAKKSTFLLALSTIFAGNELCSQEQGRNPLGIVASTIGDSSPEKHELAALSRVIERRGDHSMPADTKDMPFAHS